MPSSWPFDKFQPIVEELVVRFPRLTDGAVGMLGTDVDVLDELHLRVVERNVRYAS